MGADVPSSTNDTIGSLKFTTTDIYSNGETAPIWLFVILNGIAGTGVIINIIHLSFMIKLNVGVWTAAKNFKVFVIFLAFTDLFLSTGRLSVNNITVQEYMHTTRWLCIMSPTLLHALNVYQTNLLSLASLERFIAVMTGVNYSSKFFVKQYPKILGVFLILWLTVYTAIAVVFRDIGYSTQGAGACKLASTDVPRLDLVTGIAGLLNLIALILFYTLLLCKSRRMNKKMDKRRGKKAAKVSKRSARLNRTVSALVITKLVLWVPIIVLLIVRTFGVQILGLGYAGSISLYLCSIANPIMYGCTSSKYRKFIISSMCCGRFATYSSSTGVPTSYSKSLHGKDRLKTLTVSEVVTPDTSTSGHSELNLIKGDTIEWSTKNSANASEH